GDVVGIDEVHLVALDGGGAGEADAGVAGRGLDDRPAGRQLPRALGLLDHAQGDPVLVRPARVQVLELDEEGRTELPADLLEADDRRSADQVEQRRILARHRRKAYSRSTRSRNAATSSRERSGSPTTAMADAA